MFSAHINAIVATLSKVLCESPASLLLHNVWPLQSLFGVHGQLFSVYKNGGLVRLEGAEVVIVNADGSQRFALIDCHLLCGRFKAFV